MARLCINIQKKIKKSYSFYKFEFSGNAFKTIAFYRNDSNGNGVYDENDEYECNETICTFEEWTSSAEGYFSIDKMEMCRFAYDGMERLQ